mmetsp:Transcript_88416/g.270624  ORF Transcript_88416/g.270624 Transcript_88416/m.270624 type:complete len:283 (-) Transcript_88416:98-946(-)
MPSGSTSGTWFFSQPWRSSSKFNEPSAFLSNALNAASFVPKCLIRCFLKRMIQATCKSTSFMIAGSIRGFRLFLALCVDDPPPANSLNVITPLPAVSMALNTARGSMSPCSSDRWALPAGVCMNSVSVTFPTPLTSAAAKTSCSDPCARSMLRRNRSAGAFGLASSPLASVALVPSSRWPGLAASGPMSCLSSMTASIRWKSWSRFMCRKTSQGTRPSRPKSSRSNIRRKWNGPWSSPSGTPCLLKHSSSSSMDMSPSRFVSTAARVCSRPPKWATRTCRTR